VLLRPVGKVIAMTFLNYAEAVKDPAQFEKEVLPVEVDPQELDVAKTLAGQMAAGKFDLAAYRDKYKENVRRLVQAKAKGREVIAPPPEQAPAAVTNLMEALQQSVAAARKAAAAGRRVSSRRVRPQRRRSSGSARRPDRGSRHPGTTAL
jgi:DNA end-binding protein Ku